MWLALPDILMSTEAAVTRKEAFDGGIREMKEN
jgi:hypothetical protein